MARVTVEDCVIKVPNRFDLVLYSGQRSRQISSGAELLVDRDRDKNPVVALREIAEDKVDPADMKEDIVHGLQKHVEVDEPEEDDPNLLMQGKEPEAEAGEAAVDADKDIQEENLEKQTLEEAGDANIIEPEDE